MDVLLRPSRDTLCHLPGVVSTVPWRGLVSNSAPLQDPREPLGCRLDKFLRMPRGNASPRPNLIIARHRHTKAPPPVSTRNRTAIENLPSTPSTIMESSSKPKTRSAFPFFFEWQEEPLPQRSQRSPARPSTSRLRTRCWSC